MLINRQGLLTGDLNIIQRLGLSWLMAEEFQEESIRDKILAVHTGLASNPATARGFIQNALDSLRPESEEDIEWLTPESPEELEEFLKSFGQGS